MTRTLRDHADTSDETGDDPVTVDQARVLLRDFLQGGPRSRDDAFACKAFVDEYWLAVENVRREMISAAVCLLLDGRDEERELAGSCLALVPASEESVARVVDAYCLCADPTWAQYLGSFGVVLGLPSGRGREMLALLGIDQPGAAGGSQGRGAR